MRASARRPTVCAIILNYFGAAKTERCLRSLRNEQLTTLLLVDNSATDAQRATLAKTLCAMEERGISFPTHAVYNDDNLGFGRGINRAIAADLKSTGGHNYYLLLNNDAEATPGLVGGLLRAAVADPRLALVSPLIRWGEEDVGYYWYQPFLGHVSRKPFPGSFPYLSGCCLLVDATLCSDGQLFDEDFFMYGEDVELTARARHAGRTIACVDDLLAIHEGSGSSSHGGLFYEYHVARGHVLLARKLADSFGQRVAFFVGRAAYLSARALIRAVRYRTGAPIKALGLAWAGRTVGSPRRMSVTGGEPEVRLLSAVESTNGKRS